MPDFLLTFFSTVFYTPKSRMFIILVCLTNLLVDTHAELEWSKEEEETEEES